MTENNKNQKQTQDNNVQLEKRGEEVITSPSNTGNVTSEKKPAEEASSTPPPHPAGRHEKGRVIKGAPYCKAYIKATFNNTIVSITDMSGNVVAWSSAGKIGFSGSRKSTAYAGGLVGEDAAKQALAKGLRIVEVYVQGPGAGRESAIRAIQAAGLNITLIKDVTPIPHDGCRPRKRRRV
jgi:small subunit ribosomal protein S11